MTKPLPNTTQHLPFTGTLSVAGPTEAKAQSLRPRKYVHTRTLANKLTRVHLQKRACVEKGAVLRRHDKPRRQEPARA